MVTLYTSITAGVAVGVAVGVGSAVDVYVNDVNPVQLYALDSTVSFHVCCQ